MKRWLMPSKLRMAVRFLVSSNGPIFHRCPLKSLVFLASVSRKAIYAPLPLERGLGVRL